MPESSRFDTRFATTSLNYCYMKGGESIARAWAQFCSSSRQHVVLLSVILWKNPTSRNFERHLKVEHQARTLSKSTWRCLNRCGLALPSWITLSRFSPTYLINSSIKSPLSRGCYQSRSHLDFLLRPDFVAQTGKTSVVTPSHQRISCHVQPQRGAAPQYLTAAFAISRSQIGVFRFTAFTSSYQV